MRGRLRVMDSIHGVRHETLRGLCRIEKPALANDLCAILRCRASAAIRLLAADVLHLPMGTHQVRRIHQALRGHRGIKHPLRLPGQRHIRIFPSEHVQQTVLPVPLYDTRLGPTPRFVLQLLERKKLCNARN